MNSPLTPQSVGIPGQDRAGLGEDKSELYLDLYFKLAEQQGQQLPSREDLLSDPQVVKLFNILSQNQRATFASANHPILADKETEYLTPRGLRVAVIKDTASEFVIGSHGVTIMETTFGPDTWLPIAPDVSISLSDMPGVINKDISTDKFVERHNRAALTLSAQVAGRSKEAIRELLDAMD